MTKMDVMTNTFMNGGTQAVLIIYLTTIVLKNIDGYLLTLMMAQNMKLSQSAKNDDFLRLIYDYFTDNVSGEHSDEEVKEAITSAIWSL